ncbi:MAG: YidC/Oxa1 family insertase periplasmic-domain containing protein [Candidatus Omnitrophota bacterium]
MDLQKRTFIAVVLSIVIIIIYSSWVSKFYPTVNKEVIEKSSITSSGETVAQPQTAKVAPPQKVKTQTNPPLIQYETEKVTYKFTPLGGNLISARFKDYAYEAPALALLAIQEWQDLEFSHELGPEEAVFRYKDANKEITKQYKFSEKGYYINFEITYNNLTSSAASCYYNFNLEFKHSPAERYRDTVVFFNDSNLLYLNNLRNKPGFIRELNKSIKWIGLRDKYFAYILSPISNKNELGKIEKSLDGSDILSLHHKDEAISAGSMQTASFLYYCGPQIDNLLVKSGVGFEYIHNFGKLDVFVKLLLKTLININKFVHNWGVSIIVLSVVIYLCLYPLSLKSMRSMKKMQVLQPEVEKIKQQYKNDVQRQNKEVMELYKKHNYNPLGGCMPMLLQLPIFYALFLALSRGIEFKGANFLWIKDLSEPDRFPIFAGKHINILPILMIIAMFFQQKMSMSNLPSSQSEQQKMMLWMMPALFGIMFYNMPSGLVLYWVLNSSLTMVSQWKALK